MGGPIIIVLLVIFGLSYGEDPNHVKVKMGENKKHGPGLINNGININVRVFGLNHLLRGHKNLVHSKCRYEDGPAKNIALGRPAGQSSVYTKHKSGPDIANRAVDGKLGPSPDTGECAVTGFEEKPYWYIDLGECAMIERIGIFGRNTESGVQSANFDVYVTDKKPTDSQNAPGDIGHCHYREDPAPPLTGYEFPCVESGRYVVIHKRDTQHLSLCEVRVFGKKGTH